MFKPHSYSESSFSCKGRKADMGPQPCRGGMVSDCRPVNMLLSCKQEATRNIDWVAYTWRELHVTNYSLTSSKLK
jgi:hypothetical protein